MLGLTDEARCRRSIARLRLGPENLVLDCGVNVAELTEMFARTGAEVHAFEPNPHAFAVLRERCKKFPRVVCHNAAVGTADGRQPLYFHELSASDEVLYSNGSSLLAEKPNISRERSVEVEVLDLAKFIITLPQPVDVMKMDIEGAEAAVLDHLLATGAMKHIKLALVETHEEKIPSLAPSIARLKAAITAQTPCEVRWDWV